MNSSCFGVDRKVCVHSDAFLKDMTPIEKFTNHLKSVALKSWTSKYGAHDRFSKWVPNLRIEAGGISLTSNKHAHCL